MCIYIYAFYIILMVFMKIPSSVRENQSLSPPCVLAGAVANRVEEEVSISHRPLERNAGGLCSDEAKPADWHTILFFLQGFLRFRNV